MNFCLIYIIKGIKFNFKPLNKNITLHTACHSRAQNIGSKSFSLLNLVTKDKNINVEKCSGHGGTWGIKSKWNKTAKKVGLPAARQIFKKRRRYFSINMSISSIAF